MIGSPGDQRVVCLLIGNKPIKSFRMVGLVDDLLEQLQNCPLVRNVRIISYDETPIGKLEVKLR